MGTRQGEPFQTTSLTLYSLHKLLLSGKAKEKFSIILAIGVAPIMCRKSPRYEGRKISERKAAGKVKMQAGWDGKFAER